MAAQKRCRAEADGQDETSTAIFPPKTAIELAMEEAEEYERRKEAEQRRLQQLKLASLDQGETRLLAPVHHDASPPYDSQIDHQVDRQGCDEHEDKLDASCPMPEKADVMLGSQLYNDELHHSSKNNWHENKNMAINKLRLPRKLLEKWVEEPFFDIAVVGCFVRLGVGKAPGLRCEPQYKVCEIIGVGEYKHSYALGEFQTKKALLLRIGRNTRLWRMNVISNHRFTSDELNEWQSTMFAARQKIPSAEEVSKRKARMREAVFGASSHSAQDITDTKIFSKASERYSEGDVARLVNSRRKRSEAARFRERQTTIVARLNHGQIRTRYEHEVSAARQAYLALLIAQSTKVRTTAEIRSAIDKVYMISEKYMSSYSC